jgi:hypothetical protein
MAKAAPKNKPAPKPGKIHRAAATLKIESDVQADAKRARTVLIDDPLPKGADWLKNALTRLKSQADCPGTVTEIAHRLALEMDGAFRRGAVIEAWGWGAIKNNLLTWEWWPKVRRKKSSDAS